LAEIGFYHLLSMSLERALPKLLERACAHGHRVVVRAASAERVEHLNAALWTYEEAAFLAHGSARDGNPAMQPIWLTHLAENPNGASMIVLATRPRSRAQFDLLAADGVGLGAKGLKRRRFTPGFYPRVCRPSQRSL